MLKQDRLPFKEDSQLLQKGWDLSRLVEQVCRHFKIDPEEITQRGRKNALSTAKAVICYLRVKILKISSDEIGERLPSASQRYQWPYLVDIDIAGSMA